MHETVNRFLSGGDKSMPKMQQRQPGFIFSVCGSFTKNKEIIQKFKEVGESRYIYQNELDKSCLQHDMVHGDLNPNLGVGDNFTAPVGFLIITRKR